MYPGGFAVQSPPVKLYWYGFEGTTHTMQKAGWQFEQFRMDRSFSDVVRFYHPKFKTYGSFAIDDVWRKYSYKDYVHALEISVECNLAGDYLIHEEYMLTAEHWKLDMQPRYVDQRFIHLSKCNIFAPAESKESKKIIIPKELDISSMLANIIAKQEPEQIKYFEEYVNNKKPLPAHKVSAQIIQLTDYKEAA